MRHGVLQTNLRATKLKPAKLAKQLGNIDTPLDKDEQVDLLGDAVDMRQFSDGLAVGTIGGGNHFAELQTVDTVYRADLLPPDFDENHLQLLVHSGSRGLGQQILQRHMLPVGIKVWRKMAKRRQPILPNTKQPWNLPALTAV